MKTAKLKILRNEDGDVTVLLNDMELETIDQIKLFVSPDDDEAKLTIALKVPGIEIESDIQDIQLTTAAYQRCEKCGKWIIPSIAKNLEEKIVEAVYECKAPHPKTGESCNWRKTMKIQDWNNGLQNKAPITKMEGEE